MQITLERGGKFTASTMVPNKCKCAAMSTKTYQYFVRIDATDAKLTPEGYVLNNEKIGEYFEVTFGRRANRWDAMSCEKMALKAAKELFAEMLAEGVECECVEVHLKGSNGAWIKARCFPKDVGARVS